MSVAPESLLAVRRYLKTKGVDDSGIRGTVGPKRNSGYHLGKSDIYGAGGLGAKDYSIRRPRDLRGLSNAASAMDFKQMPAGTTLKKFVHHMVSEARAGRADLQEIIGPVGTPNGTRAADFRKPDWVAIIRADPNDGHTWHAHLSFPRDTEFVDRVAMFESFFGARDVVVPEPEPEPEPEPTPPPPTPEELLRIEVAELKERIVSAQKELAG